MQPRFVGRLGVADAGTAANAALGFVAVVSVLSLALVGDVSGMAVVLVGGAGLVALGTVGFLLVRVTGRVDRFLVRAARVPSPLERVTASYVRGEMDEAELERRLERVLSTPGYVDDTPPRSVAAARSPRGGGSTHVPRSDTAAETAGLAERLVDR